MDDRQRIEDRRNEREDRRNPRGIRLRIQPLRANNLGVDFRPLPGDPPVRSKPTTNEES